jgi:beta-glucanase (GH16 family)
MLSSTPVLSARLILTLLLCAPALAQTTPAWRLIWSDEFAQPDGSAPASTNWTYDLGGNGWGNSELESYTSRRTNSWIENGCLIIQAQKENYTGTDNIPRNYTSARLKSQAKQSWAYGRIEARVKVPYGQGIWPAFWTLGTNITSVNWPTCGEIDIMENIGREPTLAHGTIHGPGYSGGNGITSQVTVPGGKNLADDFHLFAIEWETNRIRWFLDNVQFFQVTPANLPPGTTWVFDKPQFILLNVAVGGQWPGNPDATTIFPQRMTIDYVRVYARTNSPVADLQFTQTKITWPIDFPHARLQRVSAIGQIWQDLPITGVIESNKFTQTIDPGFYHLRWQ